MALFQHLRETSGEGPLPHGASVAPSVKWAGLIGDVDVLLEARVMQFCEALERRDEGEDSSLGGDGRGWLGQEAESEGALGWEQGWNIPAHSPVTSKPQEGSSHVISEPVNTL